MNHNTNEKPSGGDHEERLALAFGRARNPTPDDVSPHWLGSYYIDEQRRWLEYSARKRKLDIVVFAVGYGRNGPGIGSVLDALLALAQERGIRTLLVPTRRYLTPLKDDEAPYYWERKFTDAGIEIIEALNEELV